MTFTLYSGQVECSLETSSLLSIRNIDSSSTIVTNWANSSYLYITK